MSGHDVEEDPPKPGGSERETAPPSGRLGRVDAWFADLRADDTRRRIALAGAVVVGLVAAMVHWLGLVVGGALVGLTRRSLGRALFAGLGFGLLVHVAFFVLTPVIAPGNLLALAPLSYLTLGLALVAPVWGALVRAIV